MSNRKQNAEPLLKALGQKTAYQFDKPNPKLLETFANRHPQQLYLIKLYCHEFTSICPITGQPDWGTFLIRYVPNQKCVESKSLKLYLHSFRNHGEFHEDVTNRIANDLLALCKPFYLQIEGRFHPRGGIAIHPFVEHWGTTNATQKIAIEKLLCHEPKGKKTL